MGLRLESGCIADRCPCGIAAPPASIYPVYSIGRTSFSHWPPSAEPAPDRASESPSLAPFSRHLAVGMACTDCVGRPRCDRDAIACQIYSTLPGAADASAPNPDAFATRSALSGFAEELSKRFDAEEGRLHCGLAAYWKKARRAKRKIQKRPMQCQYQAAESTRIWRVSIWRET